MSSYANVPDNGIVYKNSFYERLQQAFDKHNHQFKQTAMVSVTLGNPSSTRLNSSGNLKMSVNISRNTNDPPNYTEAIINGKFNTPGSLKTILDTIMNADFVATPTTDNLATAPALSANGITYEPNPHTVNMRALLDQAKANPLIAWNLNVNRKMNIPESRKIAAHVVSKLNHVIDYVITNDIKEPDNEFRKRILNIFANNEGNPYPFAINTLMLPAMVNYVASKGGNAKTEHAMRYVGIVKKGSKIFPKDGATKFQSDKWIPSDEIIFLHTPCTYAILNNNQKQFSIGAYNYPFADGSTFKPTKFAVLTTSESDPVITNITTPQPNDKYDATVDYSKIVLAKTPKNKDNSGRFDPLPIKYFRNLDWDKEFTEHTRYKDHAVKIKTQNIDCSKTWREFVTKNVECDENDPTCGGLIKS